MGVAYGPNVRNDYDLYLAKSARPTPLVLYFFPGGFVVGNKNTVPIAWLDAAKAARVTVASCNYRYVTDAPFPASFYDAARALQFPRLHAAEYDIDAKAVASTGSSAAPTLGVECVLRLKTDYRNPPVEMNREMVDFSLRHFPN